MIDLVLPYPISANAYWAQRVIKVKGRHMPVTYVTHEAREYKADVAKRCRAAGVLQPFSGRVAILVWLYPHRPQDWQARQRKHGAAWDDDVRSIDIDNANKVLIDAFKGVVIVDDSRRYLRRLWGDHMEPDAFGARVVVRIKPMPTEVRQLELVA